MTDTRTFRVVDEDGDYYEITGDPMDALNALTARVAELERELLALRGTELNPSPTILDAQSYGELRDEIAATMTDDWDGEDSEIYILIRYVRWLAAGMPRDEDGYPIRRESYPAAEAERDGDVRAVAAALQAWAVGDNTKLGSALMALREVFIARIAELQVRTTRAELDAREAKAGER